MRRCIGCYQSLPQDELVRFTFKDDKFVVDGTEGRGLYLCKKKECFEMALKKKAFNRIAQRNVDPEELQNVIDAIQ